MGERSLTFYETLPSCDIFEFHAEVNLTYAVADPAVILRSARTDAGQFLKNSTIDVMRQASRRYSYDQIGEAENFIAKKVEDGICDKGFKLTRPCFVKLSLDESVRNLLIERGINEKKFIDETLRIKNKNEIDRLDQEGRLDLKKMRADVIAPLIKDGDWERLLAMFDPNDPADEYLKQILAVLSEKRRNQDDIYNKVIEFALSKGVIESHELSELAKKLLIDKTGLDKTIAYISNKTEPISEEECNIPDEISRGKEK